MQMRPKHRGWDITLMVDHGYYLISMPDDPDFIQVPFWSEEDARTGIDERIDHPERFPSYETCEPEAPRPPSPTAWERILEDVL